MEQIEDLLRGIRVAARRVEQEIDRNSSGSEVVGQINHCVDVRARHLTELMLEAGVIDEKAPARHLLNVADQLLTLFGALDKLLGAAQDVAVDWIRHPVESSPASDPFGGDWPGLPGQLERVGSGQRSTRPIAAGPDGVRPPLR